MMEEQMSPGVLAALETGRNILHVLGARLALHADYISLGINKESIYL